MTDKKEPPFFNDDSMGAFHYKLPFYDTMELFIETLTGTCFELRVLPFEAVISVKAKIQRLEGIPVAQQHLIWNNLELDDEHCLHDYGIAEGCTLKLVLALRGGPINTRRVTLEDPIKDVADLMESTKEEVWEKSQANKQVTFVVYREGDQLNFFRVVDRGDGTLTPLSESLSGSTVYNVCAEEEDGEGGAATRQSLENSITMNKMRQLKAKMEDMNLNKKPKKTAKVKPRPPLSPHPFAGSLGPPGTRHQHRLFRSFPHGGGQPWQPNAQLPPIADVKPAEPLFPPCASASARPSFPRRQAPPPCSPSCYVLQEEEPCAPFAKLRPPTKVSRLDVGGGRLMRDCVYPQLPPLCIRGPPDSTFDPADSAAADALGLGLLEEAAGLVVPSQSGVPFGELSDPLSLDVSTPPEGSLSPSPLATWTLGTGDGLASRADGTLLGTSFHISPPSPSPAPASSTGRLPAPGIRALSPVQLTPGSASPCPLSAPCLRGVKVESPGRRPELISKREARSITRMANQACKEPLGSMNGSDLLASLSSRAPAPHSSSSGVGGRESLGECLGLSLAMPFTAAAAAAASGQESLGSGLHSSQTNRLLQKELLSQTSPLHRAAAAYKVKDPLASAGGVASSLGRIGAPTFHLPPVKGPTGGRKKSSKHCFHCGKKTGLATSYECRCGHNFCASHRYAETHDCTYDYKSAGRRFLQETNPLVSAPKLPKI